MNSLLKVTLLVCLASVCFSSIYDPCPQPKVCLSEGVVTQACYNTQMRSMMLSSFIDQQHLYVTNIDNVQEDSSFLRSCPEVVKGGNVTLKYESQQYLLEQAMLDEEERGLVLLNYNSLAQKIKFDESIEKMRAEKQVLMASLKQLQGTMDL